jgi:cobalt-zinc-cadmium efflux system outer membrane protein
MRGVGNGPGSFCYWTITLSLCGFGCAGSDRAPGREQIDEAIRQRTGAGLRPEGAGDEVPPGVLLSDGLTAEEAVATSLWNNPAFEASLAELGLARADLAEARLLKNPVLSLLFPLGPKQLEWTLSFAVDALWQRPRRVEAFTLNAQSVGERLVSQGLTLIADVRRGYLDAVAAEERVALATGNAELLKRIADISDARLRAGDISELEARAARSDRARAVADLLAREHDRDAAKVALISLMGFDMPPGELRLTPAEETPSASCGAPEALIADALASRPDVRAAEISIEAAGARASWERTRVFSLIASLDANGEGREGFEMGPGIVADIPIFSRNQGGISRADAELSRASRSYLAVRTQVAAEVRTASIRFDQAQRAARIWEDEIVPSLEIEVRQAERAYQAGEVALLSLLDASRRLIDARGRRLESSVDLQKAAVALERSVGHSCAGS